MSNIKWGFIYVPPLTKIGERSHFCKAKTFDITQKHGSDLGKVGVVALTSPWFLC